MTTNIYTGIEVPYEVQLIHDASVSTTYMTPLPDQQSEGANNPWEHKLEPGVYMATVTYNGTEPATLHQIGGQDDITNVTVPQSDTPRTRSSSPIKISVNSENEYLAVTSNGTGDYRATISIIPTPTYNEFDTSTGATTVDERFTQLETQLSDKADVTALDSRVPETLALRRDTSVGTRIMAGDAMIHGDTGLRNITSTLLPGWSGSLYVRRIGREVTIGGSSLRPPSSGTVGITEIPTGFRQSRTVVGVGSEGNAFRPVYALAYNPYRIEIRGVAAAQSWISADISYITDDPWPSTLPGTPA